MKYVVRIFYSLVIVLTANIPLLMGSYIQPVWTLFLGIGFIFLNIKPSLHSGRLPRKRLRLCENGCELLKLFLISMTVSAVFLIVSLPSVFKGDTVSVFFPGMNAITFSENKFMWFLDLLIVILIEAVLFWNGILRVYLSSSQIGIKWRVIGIVCGWIPVVNLIVLWKIIRLSSAETEFESLKIQSNELRREDKLCDTQYPILLVHGVFFRDFKYFNYWGRIPGELEQNGATIYYGNHQSAASVSDSGKELAERILQLVKEKGVEKVNIIAHSKGGLDCRYAVSALGMDKYIASLTTINTPHRGCVFADYLLSKIPQSVKNKVAESYNAALRKMGDFNPDFIAAVTDLTASACKCFNEKIKDMPGIYYQSVGSKLNVASGGRFPLNFSYQLVKYFDGANDGLVSEDSFPWGEDYTFLTTKERRGISHGDMIDLNRENRKDFDVREFYVDLVNQLKKMGY